MLNPTLGCLDPPERRWYREVPPGIRPRDVTLSARIVKGSAVAVPTIGGEMFASVELHPISLGARRIAERTRSTRTRAPGAWPYDHPGPVVDASARYGSVIEWGEARKIGVVVLDGDATR